MGDPARLPAMQAASVGARDGQVRLALLFARARLLGDGSASGLREALGDRRLGDQAADYLRELGLAP